MEIASTVSEFGQSRRRVRMGEGGTVEAASIKRRRRDPSPSVSAKQQQPPQADQVTTTTVKRSSKYRGVSKHRWTGRYEAHLWDKGSWNPTQRKKGKQVYLGAYDEEESAARAYDLAALKYWGTLTFTNFAVSEYEQEIEIMKTVTREEYLATLRRRSSGFSRGVSRYRGVARHHHNGRWEARIGRVFGNKYLYLGTYGTQEEAAHAYDIAAIEYRGINAVTNFDLSTYIRWIKPAPGAESDNPAFHETKQVLDSQPMTSLLPNHVPMEQHHITDLAIFRTSNSCPLDDLDITKKQEIFPTDMKTLPFSIGTKSSSSSPTALSLLLRSSVFKELVEKNLNTNDKVNGDENDTKNIPKIGSKNKVEETVYDEIGIDNSVQYICPSKMYFMA